MLFMTCFAKEKWAYLFLKKIRLSILTDLHVLGCLDHDLIVFRRCLTIYVSFYAKQTLYSKCKAKTITPNFSKLFTQLHTDLNWYWSTFVENRPTGVAVVSFKKIRMLRSTWNCTNSTIINKIVSIC